MAEHDLWSVAFPKLEDEQIARLAACSRVALTRHRAGEVLFEAGDRDFRFFIVHSGEIEIVDPSGDEPKVVVVHQKGNFTGDVSHLTGRAAIVRAVARTDCEVYEMSNASLREIINQCPDLGDLILHAFIARRQLMRESGAITGLRVIGSRYSQDTSRIRDFLLRNRVLFTWLDLEADPEVDVLLRRFEITAEETPLVVWGEHRLRNPSNRELADAIGIRRAPLNTTYDLAIVGAGPAGLAAAVYGASEGLNTALLEDSAPGGQAGSSMRIENYLGFPTGITGGELADRALLQANKFGVLLSVPSTVVRLAFDGVFAVLEIEGGETIAAKCLLVATGAHYRRLDVDGCDRFEGCGVYYAATTNEADFGRGTDVVIVGGGNSAGQAVVFMAAHARKVHLVIRGDDLNKSMSSYLVHRIEQTPNVEVVRNTVVHAMAGDSHLRTVELIDRRSGETRRIETSMLFSFIGATPKTEWLPPEIARDAHGFLRTGTELMDAGLWTTKRPPFLLETSRPGVLAAGDVRSNSVKRVASAVGEGAMAVQFVHEYLKTL